MLNPEQIEIRKPFWQAFSDLWLDNELQDFEIEYTANLMKSNDLGLSEFENIFYLEVAPVVYKNLHSVAGEGRVLIGNGFLIRSSRTLKNRNPIQFTGFG